MDFEKAFDSLDRETFGGLWGITRFLRNFVTLIHNTYEGMTCKVMHASLVSAGFEFLTGARQGSILSPFLFLLAIDWIIRKTTANERTESSGLLIQLYDLSYAYDFALL